MEELTDIEKKHPALNYSALFRVPVVELPDEQWPAVLDTLEIQPSWPQFAQGPDTGLLKRYHETMHISDRMDIPIRFVGFAPLFSDTRLYRGSGCDWVMLNLGNDPLYSFHRNKLYAPPPVLQDIRNIQAAGLEFDAIFIAHEIPADTIKPGEKIPLELIAPPPSPAVQPRLQFLEESSKDWWGLVTGIVKKAVTTPVVAAAHATALVTRDPVLFGVQFKGDRELDQAPVGLWYYLTHWYWPPWEADR